MDLDWLGRVAATAYVAVLALLCVYGLHRYFLVVLYWGVRKQETPRAAAFDELPRVTVQLPMFNEKHVARRVIEHACRIDYPRDRIEIQVLDDSTDETIEIVRETIERMRRAGHNVTLQHRTDRTGYKAGALQEGMKTATGDFIAIFDADFLPPPNILRDTIHYFSDERVGMVQCRWDHLNRDDSLLTRAQAVLLDGHFLIEHTARNRTGRFMSFNGTAGIWRRTAIGDSGGWQHDTLTEDLDLSYRAQLRGWKFVFLPELTSPAELPPEMNSFKAQQHRWTKGGAQTCVKMLPRVLREAGDWRVKVEAFFHLTSGFVYVLMLALSLLLGPALIYKLAADPAPESPWRVGMDFALFIIGTGSALSFYIVSQRRLERSWLHIAKTIPALMAIGVGIAFNNAIAAIEGFFSKSGEFVRTPKFGEQISDANGWRQKLAGFRFGGIWRGWAELAIAVYMLGCLATLFLFEHWFERVSAAIPFLGLFIFGYLYVAVSSLRGQWLASRPAASLSEASSAEPVS